MRRSYRQRRGQFVLELERSEPPEPLTQGANGLVEALADLLLEALAAQAMTKMEGGNEHQDHA